MNIVSNIQIVKKPKQKKKNKKKHYEKENIYERVDFFFCSNVVLIILLYNFSLN